MHDVAHDPGQTRHGTNKCKAAFFSCSRCWCHLCMTFPDWVKDSVNWDMQDRLFDEHWLVLISRTAVAMFALLCGVALQHHRSHCCKLNGWTAKLRPQNLLWHRFMTGYCRIGTEGRFWASFNLCRAFCVRRWTWPKWWRLSSTSVSFAGRSCWSENLIFGWLVTTWSYDDNYRREERVLFSNIVAFAAMNQRLTATQTCEEYKLWQLVPRKNWCQMLSWVCRRWHF